MQQAGEGAPVPGRGEGAGRRGLRRAGYAAALLVSSAGGLVLEIVAGRMIAPYVGMSLYTWTAVIAVVLAGFSVGHWIGGLLTEGGRRLCYRRLAWLLLAAAASAAACLPLIRLLAPLVLGGGTDPILAIVVFTGLLFFLPSLFVGTVSPILTRLAVLETPERPGVAIGQMFALGAVGSIAGTLLAGYLFLSWIGSTWTVLSVAAGYLALSAGFALAARLRALEAAGLAATAGAALVAILVPSQRLAALTPPCQVESDYYCLNAVDFSAEVGRPAKLMVIDHMAHGINDRDDPTVLHSSYLDLVDRLVPLRLGGATAFEALFVGGGAYTLPRAWQETYPDAGLTVFEIDPAVTRLAEAEFWFEPEGVEVRHQDGRLGLERMPPVRRFDVVVGDAFHDFAAPPHLVTREFAELLRARLAPGGFYAQNVIDSAAAPRFLYAFVATLRQVFEEVEVWVDLEQLRGGDRGTYLVVAGAAPSGTDRLASPRHSWVLWPEEILAPRLAAAEVPVLTDDYAPVARLMHAVIGDEF
jgi:MFS family permease